MSRKTLFILSVLAAASFNASACYTVFDRANRVAYQGLQAPVDMRLQLHLALQARFPGGTMMFDQASACQPVRYTQAAVPAAVPNTAVMGAGPANGKAVRAGTRAAALGTSPLLTDARTAKSMKLPYRPVEGRIVVVPAETASRS